MRLALFADGDVGESTVRYLIKNYPDDIAAIIFVPTQTSQIAELASDAGIAIIPFQTTDQFLLAAKELLPLDLGILAWWPKIIQKDVIDLARHGFINFHPSLLPFNRGKNYNFWCLVEQSPFGVTLHLVDQGIDTGPILFQREIAYDWTDTGGSLFFKAKSAIVELFIEHYPTIRTLNWEATPQRADVGSSHLAKEMPEASIIYLDERLSVREILNKLRARTFPGYPACSFEEDGKRYEVRVQIDEIELEQK
jgi:methionyl-tRNA formyltransferase